jgi:RNA polymerase sigma-70 factor (ECF subfamily)
VSAQDTRFFVAELYRRHNERLLGFLANRVRNARLHAADLAQEVYLRLSRISRPQTIREPQAYLFRVARNVIHDHQLGLAGLPPTTELSELGEEGGVGAVNDPALQIEQRQRLEHILHVLEGVPPRARAIFTMHRAYGHTLEEMAVMFGISRSQVKKDFAKAVLYLNSGSSSAAYIFSYPTTSAPVRPGSFAAQCSPIIQRQISTSWQGLSKRCWPRAATYRFGARPCPPRKRTRHVRHRLSAPSRRVAATDERSGSRSHAAIR